MYVRIVVKITTKQFKILSVDIFGVGRGSKHFVFTVITPSSDSSIQILHILYNNVYFVHTVTRHQKLEIVHSLKGSPEFYV